MTFPKLKTQCAYFILLSSHNIGGMYEEDISSDPYVLEGSLETIIIPHPFVMGVKKLRSYDIK